MKTVIILGDGMSDHPVEALGGRTPLMVARKPHIDRIAREGRMGLFTTIEGDLPPGSDVANLAVLGYDPARLQNGRAVLEAASMGVALGPADVALRLNIITTADGAIVNHSAGHIGNDEAAAIVATLAQELGADGAGARPFTLHPGVSYRHLIVLRGWGDPAVDCAPPHDHVGEPVEALLPRAKSPAAEETARFLVELTRRSWEILARHPVNLARRAAGRDEATSLWTWSPGRRPTMPTYAELHGISGAVISAVDLVRGLGRYAGLEAIEVEGATGLHDTNYEGKAAAALAALERHDFVYVHVEATDEASHSRDLDLKIRCIEMLDERLVRPILEGLEGLARRGVETTVAVLPDHPTPVATGKHARDPVPVAIRTPGLAPDATTAFDEREAANGALGHLRGDAFIKLALGR